MHYMRYICNVDGDFCTIYTANGRNLKAPDPSLAETNLEQCERKCYVIQLQHDYQQKICNDYLKYFTLRTEMIIACSEHIATFLVTSHLHMFV